MDWYLIFDFTAFVSLFRVSMHFMSGVSNAIARSSLEKCGWELEREKHIFAQRVAFITMKSYCFIAFSCTSLVFNAPTDCTTQPPAIFFLLLLATP